MGDIPDHWNIIPGRSLYVEKKVPNKGLKETQVLSLSYGKIRIRGEDELHGLVPASFESYQIIEPGDIICRPTDLQNDWNSLRFGLSPHKGIITSAYICFATKQGVDRRYGHLLFHTYDLKKVFYGLGSGLRQNLDWEDFKHLPCPQPATLEEQAAIVRFLDHADEQIRRYIASKERLIALLEEERQALVHQAVTRGLDPSVRLKPSGVDWMGDIPEHWRVVKLGLLASKFGSGITPRGGATVYQEAGVPFLRSQNVHFDGLRLDGVARIDPELHQELSSSHVSPRDVLLNITGASIGRVCAVPEDFGEANVNQHVCIIRPKTEAMDTVYLGAYLSTPMMQREIQANQSGASREGLTLQSIRDFPTPVPPLKEQRLISGRITEVNVGIFHSVSSARRQIDLMNEYRTRLIADVVTGQLDVREAAAQLQEVPWAAPAAPN